LNILEPPEIGYYALPEAIRRAADSTRNVLPHPISTFHNHRGSSFASLLTCGLTGEAFAVLMEMTHFSFVIETHLQGRLINPDECALRSKRDQLHHKVLSLPRGDRDTERTSVYECCRWAALLYSTSLIFPLPQATGISRTLIKEIQRCVDKTNLTMLVSGAPRQFFIWVLMLTGIAAERMPELRAWVEEMLNLLLVLEGASKWIEVKGIVESFLWIGACCDDGAMNLWDEIAIHHRGKKKTSFTPSSS
jgi:hypothetical protein